MKALIALVITVSPLFHYSTLIFPHKPVKVVVKFLLTYKIPMSYTLTDDEENPINGDADPAERQEQQSHSLSGKPGV